jgi:hypothetical protein
MIKLNNKFKPTIIFFNLAFLTIGLLSRSQYASEIHTDTSRCNGVKIDSFMCMSLIMYSSQNAWMHVLNGSL